VTPASGTAERAAALAMMGRQVGRYRATLAADKGYDTADFVAAARAMNVTPHVAQNTSGRRSAIDARTTRHPGYATSQRVRKRIEEAFGWIKTIGGLRKVRHRGTDRVNWMFTLTAAACNLVRLPKLLGGGLIMPALRPRRLAARPRRGRERLPTPAMSACNTSRSGNEGRDHLISAAY
jgi:Transposase DDE domain